MFKKKTKTLIRDKVKTVRFNSEEWAKIASASKASGLDTTEYVRSKAYITASQDLEKLGKEIAQNNKDY